MKQPGTVRKTETGRECEKATPMQEGHATIPSPPLLSGFWASTNSCLVCFSKPGLVPCGQPCGIQPHKPPGHRMAPVFKIPSFQVTELI